MILDGNPPLFLPDQGWGDVWARRPDKKGPQHVRPWKYAGFAGVVGYQPAFARPARSRRSAISPRMAGSSMVEGGA